MASRRWLFAFVILGLILGVAGVAYWQRQPVLSWYYARKLSQSEYDNCTTLTSQLETCGRCGSEAVIDLFRGEAQTACRNAALAMGELCSRWGGTDARTKHAIAYAAGQCGRFSLAGQAECLGWLQQLLSDSAEAGPELCGFAAKLLSQIGSRAEARQTALDVTAQLLRHEIGTSDELVMQARAWVVAGLQDGNPAIRASAVRLAVVPEVKALELLPPLLMDTKLDASPEVRQLTILALGNVETLLSTEALCRFLNDETAQVRLAAEQALRARGLSAQQVELARLIQHPAPAARALLPALVLDEPEIDALTWLERLSRDQSPAVRAATARAIGQQPQKRYEGVIRQLAESDKDETVQAIARYFLLAQKNQ